MGVAHLRVTDVDRALTVWRDLIGLTVVTRETQRVELGVGDRTVGFTPHMKGPAFKIYDASLGPNWHAVAFNTWAGPDVRLAPDDTVGLDHFAVEVPSAAALAEVTNRIEASGAAIKCDGLVLTTADPSGNRLRLVVVGQ